MANSRLGLRTKKGQVSSIIESTYFDVDAIAFIVSTGITDATHQSAINTLVLSLKNNSIWSKIKAAYPLIGGTSTTHKYNLKDPQDTNAAFRLTFYGGWTHDANGITGNGSNSYADTYFMPSVQYGNANSSHLSNYCRTNTTGNYLEMGCQINTSAFKFYNFLSGTCNISLNDNASSANASVSGRADAMMIASRTSSTAMFVKRNGNTEVNITASVSTQVNQNLYLGNLNLNGSPLAGYYSNRNYCWFSIGDGLTATDATNLNLAVQAFQTTLGRAI